MRTPRWTATRRRALRAATTAAPCCARSLSRCGASATRCARGREGATRTARARARSAPLHNPRPGGALRGGGGDQNLARRASEGGRLVASLSLLKGARGRSRKGGGRSRRCVSFWLAVRAVGRRARRRRACVSRACVCVALESSPRAPSRSRRAGGTSARSCTAPRHASARSGPSRRPRYVRLTDTPSPHPRRRSPHGHLTAPRRRVAQRRSRAARARGLGIRIGSRSASLVRADLAHALTASPRRFCPPFPAR